MLRGLGSSGRAYICVFDNYVTCKALAGAFCIDSRPATTACLTIGPAWHAVECQRAVCWGPCKSEAAAFRMYGSALHSPRQMELLRQPPGVWHMALHMFRELLGIYRKQRSPDTCRQGSDTTTLWKKKVSEASRL